MGIENILDKLTAAALKSPRNVSKSMPTNIVFVQEYESPVGRVITAADNTYLYLVLFEDSKNLEKHFKKVFDELHCKFVLKSNKILQMFEEEFAKYFEGKLEKISVPIKTMGSEFQTDVWQKLQEIPYASTQTYGELALSVGRSSAARAVGAACGANAHLIVIPCHRLVASGSIGGFTSGKDRKSWLIQHESKVSQLT